VIRPDRRKKGGMEEGWRRDGGGMEEGWRREAYVPYLFFSLPRLAKASTQIQRALQCVVELEQGGVGVV
jgi:hypothetical protein